MTNYDGQIIKGYHLTERIGTGGFGVVYRAYQEVVQREVAIKVILPQYANEQDFIRRFETEARIVARLEHPHIIPLFDYWRDPTGAFLVMRYLRGGSLGDLLAKGHLSTGQTMRMLEQIGNALTTAHRYNVVHRDIKPANILLDDEENAYLADFGIAKIISAEDATQDDGASGSLTYASPEQIQSQKITTRSDIYSLGFLVYKMLTGEHPYGNATTTELIYKHLQEPIPDITIVRPDLSLELANVLEVATAKIPDNRYEDIATFIAAVHQSLTEPDWQHSSDAVDVTRLRNPYLGLRAFEESDAADFFGRDKLVQQFIARLGEQSEFARFLAVTGPSGSGKSSVVKAGLLPALRWGDVPGSDDWFITEFTPTDDPIKQLESALMSIAQRPVSMLPDMLLADKHGLHRAVQQVLDGAMGDLLLVIDQFEEVFALVNDEDQRSHFLQLLYQAVTHPESRTRIIITIRADFMDRPLGYMQFGELLRQRTEFVLPLTPDEIESAITGPADVLDSL